MSAKHVVVVCCWRSGLVICARPTHHSVAGPGQNTLLSATNSIGAHFLAFRGSHRLRLISNRWHS